MKIKFTKMHGAGNDFVVIDAINQNIHFTAEQYRFIADRHFGIGADQILIVGNTTTPDVDFSYRIYNADGTEVEQCGNGARAFVKFVTEKKLSHKTCIRVETCSGIIQLLLEKNGNIKVDMGRPRFEPETLPFDTSNLENKIENEARLWPLNLPTHTIWVSAISMGNPHAVQIVSHIETAPINIEGPQIEHHPRFAKRVNAGFMEIIDRHTIKLRVFERGSGETLSCGSGACAATVAGIQRGKLDSPVKVITRGGELSIEWDNPFANVMMSGPATTIFEGEIDIF
jgi:diaminopimelate epimerase